MYEPGLLLTLCFDVCTRDDHGVTLCSLTTAAEIEKQPNIDMF